MNKNLKKIYNLSYKELIKLYDEEFKNSYWDNYILNTKNKEELIKAYIELVKENEIIGANKHTRVDK